MRLSKGSQFKVVGCIHHHAFINRESHFKVAACIYHHVPINGESQFKDVVFIYHHAFINRKVIMCSSKAKSFQNCSMQISLCVCQRESHLTVAECSSIWRSNFKLEDCRYHHGFINGKRQLNVAVFTYLNIFINGKIV